MERADCHCHTLHSDGTFSTPALLELAKERNLSGLSITDHDTLDAYEVAVPYAKTLGISLIPGIEISTHLAKNSIHVLGFAFDLKNEALHLFCQQLQQKRYQRNLEICQRLHDCKIPITLEELHQHFPESTLGRPHIAKLIVQKGFAPSMDKAFKRYLGDKGRCYVADSQTDVLEAIHLIQKAGGFAVIAHPHFIKDKKILSTLLSMPFDGIEAYYGNLGPKQEQPFLDLAQKKNWLVTGGSDFHGEKKSYQNLGCSFTPAETFSIFKQRYLQHELINQAT